MYEIRLIDANALPKCEVHTKFGNKDYTAIADVPYCQIESAPTIDPETLPIVRELREELALTTHQRDVYKSVFERITAHGDCNDCGKVKECQFAPKCGEDTRYNCPLWRGPQKEAHP